MLGHARAGKQDRREEEGEKKRIKEKVFFHLNYLLFIYLSVNKKIMNLLFHLWSYFFYSKNN